MPLNEIILILQWSFMIFVIGLIFLPITSRIFSNFQDRGYVFSKILGIGTLSYVIFILGSFHIISFSRVNIFLLLVFASVLNLLFQRKKKVFKSIPKIIILEEIIFLSAVFIWSYIRGTNPDIRGLEKFMDFGFINSLLRSNYFPPNDMWLTPYSINYYYFGHLIIATLTKLADIKSSITFNLSIATIFAFTLAGSFSIGLNMTSSFRKNKLGRIEIIGGVLTAALVTLGGNLQTIYAFFAQYTGEFATPFWKLIFSPNTFPNSYWYPNATRFIYHTIHEFPLYSFVVSDLHAHVLSLPFVILVIALLLSIFMKRKLDKYSILLISFLLAILYMTNTWDTIAYFMLSGFIISYIQWQKHDFKKIFLLLPSIIFLTAVFVFPFSLYFKPFASGIGIICSPQFLIEIGKIGPFIFEGNHCQRSPLWQLFVLYGFFFFWILSFILLLKRESFRRIREIDMFVMFLIFISLGLIILPEFLYIKDIYAGHYRANTMFKFVYQAFIMLQISSAYIILRILLRLKETKTIHLENILIFAVGLFLSVLVFYYPVFAVNSYYNGVKIYSGLDGEKYLHSLYPEDYQAISWINKNIKGSPVILEAQGDSYTDFARISANTGIPTVIGWTVHEWLWRGNYNIVSPRIADVQSIYESNAEEKTKQLLNKYNVSYVYVGGMERQKYTNLNEEKFKKIGKVIFQSAATRLYKVN